MCHPAICPGEHHSYNLSSAAVVSLPTHQAQTHTRTHTHSGSRLCACKHVLVCVVFMILGNSLLAEISFVLWREKGLRMTNGHPVREWHA